MTSGRSQVLATSNFRDWHTVVGKITWNYSYKLAKVLSVGVSVCVCLDVNQGGTNRNRCTQRLVLSRAQTY